MTNSGITTFLNCTLESLDLIAMLNGVDRFISFNETNIETQKATQTNLAEKTVFVGVVDSLQLQLRDQLVESTKYRFDIDFTRRSRYAGLTALITTVDWFVVSFRNRLSFTATEKKGNKTVNLLRDLNELSQQPYAKQIKDFEHLVHVRNCIVHASGLIESYEHEKSLREALPNIRGVTLFVDDFLGECIDLDRDAIPSRVNEMKNWLPAIEYECSRTGLLKH